jgi:serine/threonine protein phosphatase 1
MSDIHGCYDLYMKMLEKIEFTDDDTLYILGDVVDRGPKPMEVLLDMSMRANVILIFGNHDYIAYKILKQLLLELTEENIKKHFGSDLENFYRDLVEWENIGGSPTIKGFGQLKLNERESIIEYLSEFNNNLYETLTVNDRKYILAHIGLPDKMTKDNLNDFDAVDFLGPDINIDYKREYFSDIFLVTGHIPTVVIDEIYESRIYRKHNHIAIDTGAVFGYALCCLCLDTDEEFYIYNA